MKHIIFDFDGVIAETEKLKFKTLKQLLFQEGYELSKNVFVSMLGKKTGAFLREQFPKLSQATISNIEKKRRVQEATSNIELVSGVEALVHFLSEHNYILAITTGLKKAFVEQILKQNNLQKYFKVLITGEDFVASKPSPEGFLLTLKKLNTQSAIIIEDSPAGVKAGKEAGCVVYGLLSNVSTLLKADKRFSNHAKILEHFEDLRK